MDIIKNAFATLLLLQKIRSEPELSDISFNKIDRPIDLIEDRDLNCLHFYLNNFKKHVDFFVEKNIIVRTERFYAINYDGDHVEVDFDKEEDCFYLNGHPIEKEDEEDYTFINEIKINPVFLEEVDIQYKKLSKLITKENFTFVFKNEFHKAPLFIYDFKNALDLLNENKVPFDFSNFISQYENTPNETKLIGISDFNINSILLYSELVNNEITPWQKTLSLSCN